jgi:hypothetical protein
MLKKDVVKNKEKRRKLILKKKLFILQWFESVKVRFSPSEIKKSYEINHSDQL